jgi:hypothetical protein
MFPQIAVKPRAYPELKPWTSSSPWLRLLFVIVIVKVILTSPILAVMQAEDNSGRLALSFAGPGALLVDVVSLMPDDNVLKGSMNPWPFREDLMQRMRDLTPRHDTLYTHAAAPHSETISQPRWFQCIGTEASSRHCAIPQTPTRNRSPGPWGRLLVELARTCT